MNGSWSRNNEKEGKEGERSGGWASTFLKVAGAVATTAAVAGSLYSILNQPEADVAVILHVDGSLLREKQSAGCGGFLSSASEKWICGFTQKLNSNLREDETEREAILIGLRWVKEKEKKKVVVKTDNEGIAILVNSERGCNDSRIRAIRDLLNSDQWEASLSSIPRGENAVADKLAQKAHSSTFYDLQEIDDPPKNCRLLL